MQISPPFPRAGDIVRLRRLRWRVLDVRTYDGCRLLALSGTGPSNAAVERRVLMPFDVVEPVTRSARPRLVSRARWRRACRTMLADLSPPGALRAARSARIEVLPHQLEPALAVVGGMGCRLLLADAVGLGKTIQAGLVIAELRARGAADRVLIVTPAGLREQWSGELSQRFGLDAVVVDARDIRRRIATLPAGVNPWTTVPVAIASIDYVKRNVTLPSLGSCHWDMVVVDEAHNVAGDSERHAAIAALARQAAYVLLLSATPHNGDPGTFRSLCRLGEQDDRLLVFRRTREETGFAPRRHVHRLHVRTSSAERRMHALLARFTRVVRAEHREIAGDAWLVLSVLHKRALSSARALAESVARRLGAIASGTDADVQQLPLPLADEDGEIDAADSPPAWLGGPALADADRERRMLAQLEDAARSASAGETKVAALRRLLDRVAEPVVVFTEYRDTLVHLGRALGRTAAILHGGLTRRERASALDDFTSGRTSLLLATDAAGEGLNLHHRCRTVVNLELPWNPMRLEQRIGRVDRIGQTRTVHAFHLVARDTGEALVLERLRAKLAQARKDIGAADPLGTVEERAIARLVVDGAHGQDAEPDAGAPAPEEIEGAGTTTRLVPEAATETTRIVAARRLLKPDDQAARLLAEPDRPWMTFAHNRSTRARIGERMLVLVRAVFDDGSGRAEDWTIVPVSIVTPPRDFGSGGAIRLAPVELLQALAPELDRCVRAAVAPWIAEETRVRRAFSAARVDRERAIAESGTAWPPHGLFQSGLFDRRAEQMRAAAEAARAAAQDESARRIRLFDGTTARSDLRQELLLVLAR